MKKHLVMIVGNFYPKPSPTGKCAEAYIDLLKDQYDISVICQADTDQTPYSYNDKAIYPVANSYVLFQHRLAQRKAPALMQNLLKVPVHIANRFTQPNLLYSHVAAAERQLWKLHALKPINVIFSVGAPMAAHVAARNFRAQHPEIRWVTYTVDSYASQNKNTRHYVKALAFESQVLAACDQALLSEEIYNNSPTLYSSFADKCRPLPYLMPPTPERPVGNLYFDSGKTHLVYAGRFYKDIRNPEYLLQLVQAMDESCILHLYCQSDCDGLIDDYVRCSHGKIVRHTPVSVAEIQKIYAEADILVSVGNNTPEFQPSKTFEYIASGKPILNIYYEGMYDEVLAKSPFVLQLKRSLAVKDAATALQEFLTSSCNKTLLRSEIDKLYPKHSKEMIHSILKEAITK